jgi:TRAP-type C4-dicarboxylate transport system permease small subunit
MSHRPFAWEKTYPPSVSWDDPLEITTLREMFDKAVSAFASRLRRWLDIVAWLLLLGFTILLAWKLFERADSAYLSNESSFDLRLPVWPFMLVMWLGVVASVITILARIVLLLTDQRSSLEHFESLDQSETAEEQNDPS